MYGQIFFAFGHGKLFLKTQPTEGRGAAHKDSTVAVTEI